MVRAAVSHREDKSGLARHHGQDDGGAPFEIPDGAVGLAERLLHVVEDLLLQLLPPFRLQVRPTVLSKLVQEDRFG